MNIWVRRMMGAVFLIAIMMMFLCSCEIQEPKRPEAPNMEEREVQNIVLEQLGGEIISFQMSEPVYKSDEMTSSCDVVCGIQHKYMQEMLRLEIVWIYDEISEKWDTVIGILENYEDWSMLEGWYSEDRNGLRNGIFGFDRVLYPVTEDKEPQSKAQITYVSCIGEDIQRYSRELIRITETNLADFILNYGSREMQKSVEKYRVQFGLNIVSEGYSLSDFSYYGSLGNLFIGKDHIASGLKEGRIDTARGEMFYTFNEIDLNKTDLERLKYGQ